MNGLPFDLFEIKFLVNFVIYSVYVQKKVEKNGLSPYPRAEYRGREEAAFAFSAVESVR